ncbi:MAG: hypothetical protein COV74_09565 [Candidatus Omnitrophica bacterium CG11_big_fil_rev_8_21_14_0_20_45_26]|uniref:Glycosyltransferase RgtA/B/C/D-like domain-containing protein n=1 Tax=Candidatus Abzuiibacterium crystallinum TaxID=1974748 RepID=A0A2H0LLF1_9BACT|nr:MAG: hypothetical protein COV74_09565 [Candidatus Omnitrophica bacterium CG11_big_fil_rev_8_21_14_0_20_45_26]PIW65392.1 MAG: hypothetical protein COW12_02135 [Candidatus Omnitrophica bacterium CG12_big_fil_rev_8_21_14_0_65_45_16]
MKQETKDDFFISLKTYHPLMLAILVLYFGLYIYFRLVQRATDYWVDERVTVVGMQYPFWEYVTQYIPKNEYHLPGAFVLLYPIGHFLTTDNRYLFSLPYLVITGIFYWMLATVDWRKLLQLKFLSVKESHWINLAVCVLMAYHIHQIVHALEVRPYAVLSLLALLALWAVWRCYAARTFRIGLFAVLIVIGLFHNYGLLMIALAGLFLLTSEFFNSPEKTFTSCFQVLKEHRSFLATLAGVVILCIPLLMLYYRLPVFEGFDLKHFDYIDPYMYIHKGWEGIIQVIAIDYGLTGFLKIWIRPVLVAACLIGSLIFMIKRMWAALLFPIVFVVIPTLMMYVFSVYSGYYFVQRQFVWVMPFWLVYNAACLLVTIHTAREWMKTRT